jgi:UDP-N-acetylglucosamine:LPS N-acetylglucosamine transferase
MRQRIALLYLMTGGGHLSGSKALAQVLEADYGSTDETVLVNGFTDTMPIHRFFFEKGYRVSSNYLEPFWKLFYAVSGSTCVSRLMRRLTRKKVLEHLIAVFRDERITKVVVLHPILTTFAREVIDKTRPGLPLITVVMDPFTAHGAWFYESDSDFVVFSERLRRVAMERYGIEERRLHLFPFMVSPKFDHRYTEAEKASAREALGIPTDSKVILLAGGGEGLKGAEAIVAEFIRERMTETLIVVCGRNKVLHSTLTQLVKLSRHKNIHILEFVTCMSDLMNVADCIVTKGGPSTIFEALSVGKPIILATYIPGQEYGNMRFVVDQRVGWYIRSPRKILAQARAILSEPRVTEAVRRRVEELRLRSGIGDICRFIHEFPGA